MDIFNVLEMLGGLCLFLFGMNIMGDGLERRAGSSLRTLLSKITTNKFAGFFTGLGVTCIIQSSSATTVMVVGFVNSSLMTLKQAINVIIGANIGTTITGWILSLSGISGESFFIKMLQPTSFTPILAVIGIIYYMFCKKQKKKDTGAILLGFATLMFGMEIMSGAFDGLKDSEAFQQLFIMFKNPLLGLLVGAILTAIIQSSSAAVGILQAVVLGGSLVPIGAAIPIVMGTAIGTCVTAMLSCLGTKKDAKRAALAHLFFNIIGSGFWLIIYWVADIVFSPAILDQHATVVDIAIINTVIKVLSTVILFPFSAQLEKLVCKCIPDFDTDEKKIQLDELLLITPPLALEQCHSVACDMAHYSFRALKNSLSSLSNYSAETAKSILDDEDKSDRYEEALNSYLIKLSAQKMNEKDGEEATKLLRTVGDLERISDHAVNILEAVEELREKNLSLTDEALSDFATLSAAINEILDLSYTAFAENSTEAALSIEPLEEVIDNLKEQMRTRHILRMQQGNCNVEAGFAWSDLLTDIERTSDHCSNMGKSIINTKYNRIHQKDIIRAAEKNSDEFMVKFKAYDEKYALAD